MYLKMVTWNEDLQFLVNAKTEEKAIDKAMESCELYLNENFPGEIVYDVENWDEQSGCSIDDIKDRKLYEVDNVDFNLLYEIMVWRHRDIMGTYMGAIVFENAC